MTKKKYVTLQVKVSTVHIHVKTSRIKNVVVVMKNAIFTKRNQNTFQLMIRLLTDAAKKGFAQTVNIGKCRA